MLLIKKILDLIGNGFRKWSIMLIVIAIGTAFRITDLLTGIEFVSLIKSMGVAFMGANAMEYIKKFNKTDKD